MHIPRLSVLLAARATVLTTAAVSNDVMSQALITSVQNIHHGCLVNTDQLSQYTGGPLPTSVYNGSTVLSSFAAIFGAQDKMLADSLMAPNLTLPNTVAVCQTVLDTLQYSVPATVQALVDKKQQLDAAGLTGVVGESLAIFLVKHKAAGAAGGSKLNRGNETVLAAMEDEVTTVTGSIEKGIQNFSS